MTTELIKTIIHTVSKILEIPVIIILIIAMIVVVVQIGDILVEYFLERCKKSVHAPEIIKNLAGKSNEQKLEILNNSNFQKPQKRAFQKLLTSGIEGDDYKLLAVQLLTEEEDRLNRTLSITDIIARIGPMFGLMATLIPLGPGLIALGQGDTKGLSDSLLTAFDATVTGLAAAGIAFIISKIRKRWYKKDIETMETILEEVTS